jgi:hypothetical protein
MRDLAGVTIPHERKDTRKLPSGGGDAGKEVLWA